MSTKEQIEKYLDGEQRLRNKDYVTITRSEYASLMSLKNTWDSRVNTLKAKERLLAKRSQGLDKEYAKVKLKAQTMVNKASADLHKISREILKVAK